VIWRSGGASRAGTSSGSAWPGGRALTEDRGADQQQPPPPPKDDVRWLIYLAVGFVVVLALLLLSGLRSSHMGH
jgi:hypothetical protein